MFTSTKRYDIKWITELIEIFDWLFGAFIIEVINIKLAKIVKLWIFSYWLINKMKFSAKICDTLSNRLCTIIINFSLFLMISLLSDLSVIADEENAKSKNSSRGFLPSKTGLTLNIIDLKIKFSFA